MNTRNHLLQWHKVQDNKCRYPHSHLKVGPTCHCLNPPRPYLLRSSSTARPRAELEELAHPAARHTGGEAPDTRARARQRRRALLNRSSPRGARGARPSRGKARGGAPLARRWRGPRQRRARQAGGEAPDARARARRE
jgi:ATP-dependent Lhr-like helicase